MKPPSPPGAERNLRHVDMHVLAFHLPNPIPLEDYEHLVSLLTPPEQERVGKFRLVEDRALGRLALWYYLLTRGVIDPTKRPGFGRKARGKPTLTSPALNPPLGFNNSHEGRWVLLAVVRGADAEVGADVMVLPRDPQDLQEGIYEQLTPLQRQGLAIPLSAQERARRLTKLWTIKEGYTKAIGMGIGFGLERIEVDLDRDGDVEGVKVDGKAMEEDGWQLQSGVMPRGNIKGDMDGVGEGHVRMEEEVGWALICKGDDGGAWDGKMEVVEWEDMVMAFEDVQLS